MIENTSSNKTYLQLRVVLKNKDLQKMARRIRVQQLIQKECTSLHTRSKVYA